MNGISTPIDTGDTRGITVSKVVRDERGNNDAFGGWVRDEEPVIIFSKRVVQFPTLSGVRAADRHL